MSEPTLREARRYTIPNLRHYIEECRRNQKIMEDAAFEEIEKIDRAEQMIRLLEQSGGDGEQE